MLGQVGTGTLSRDLTRWWKTSVLHQEDPLLRIGETNDRSKKGSTNCVWALKDISFDVNQGEVVGIIGKNGAGKSTLLKLLSRITSPTTGEIRAKGRIASLLEVGTGFHGDLTGRENIYMNGAIMGMTRSEITRKLDEIIDFAGVERYIDTPVKRYSSGMFVRLGFAVAAFLDPEILVVDEVLAVGDAEFQRKAIGKMKDVAHGEGRTVLFVSHNMAAVKSLCTKSFLLDKGSLVYSGFTEDVIHQYLNVNKTEDRRKIIENIKWIKTGLKITRISINETDYSSSVIFSGQTSINLLIEGHTDEDFFTSPVLTFKNIDGIPLASLSEGHNRGKIEKKSKGNFRIEKVIKLPKFLNEGDFIIDLHLNHPMVEWQMRAPGCANLHSNGFLESQGRALRVSEDGFMGLESM